MPILTQPTMGGSPAVLAPGLLRNQSGNPDVTLGRLGLPYGMPRAGSPEAVRMPRGAGVGINSSPTGAVEGGDSTVSRMLANSMTPRPTGAATPAPGVPQPALMASQVAPVGPTVRPAPPVQPSPLGGPAPQPAARPTAAPAPSGQPVGGGTSSTARSAAPAAAPVTAHVSFGGAGSGEGGAGGGSLSPWYNATAAAGQNLSPNWLETQGVPPSVMMDRSEQDRLGPYGLTQYKGPEGKQDTGGTGKDRGTTETTSQERDQ